jgi:hypothetical protein
MSLIRIMVPIVALGLLAGCSSAGSANAPSSPLTGISVAPAESTSLPASAAAPSSTVVAAQDGLRSCAEIYVEGAPVTSEVLEGQCVAEDASLMLMGSAVYDCTDGSTIGWNDRAWWDDTVHLYPAATETQTAPADVIAACTG